MPKGLNLGVRGTGNLCGKGCRPSPLPYLLGLFPMTGGGSTGEAPLLTGAVLERFQKWNLASLPLYPLTSSRMWV